MKNFIKDLAERAIKTAAQALIAMMGTSMFVGEVDWIKCISAAVMASLLSVLTSLASCSITGGGSASLINNNKESDK